MHTPRTPEEWGRVGAEKRWGSRVIRLADFTPEEQAVLKAMLRLKAARERQRATSAPEAA